MSANQPDRDGWVAAIAAAFAIGAGALVVVNPGFSEAKSEVPVVATVTVASANLRRRAANALGWEEIPRGTQVRERDALFVPPGAEAQLTFNDGSTLELDERSLVVVEVPRAGRTGIRVKQGSVAGLAGTGGLTLTTDQGEAALQNGAGANVAIGNGQVAMAVTAGKIDVGGKTLQLGERADLGKGALSVLPQWKVSLDGPPPSTRTFFRGAFPKIALAATVKAVDGAQVQVARDRAFAFVVERLDVSTGHAEFIPKAAGVYWWRVVDAAGLAQSESRRFSVLEDVPPTLSLPREGDTVYAPENTATSFAWSDVRGVTDFLIEISATPDFATVTLQEPCEGNSRRLRLTMPEGIWFWRVRDADPKNPGAPSAPRKFRLIHKPLPDAPVLLNPEIEVKP